MRQATNITYKSGGLVDVVVLYIRIGVSRKFYAKNIH